MIDPIECIVDALAHVNRSDSPDSVLYQIRNPIRLRSFAKPGRHQINTEGLREFTSLLAGYKAATFDVGLKLKGLSRAGLKSDDPIEDLFRVYGLSEKSLHEKAINFIRRAMKDDSINLKTPLKFFLKGDK